MFDKIKDIYKLQKDAKAIQKELSEIHIESEIDGIIITVSAEQEIISINIPESMLTPDNKKKIEKGIIEAGKKAMKKAKEVSAEKMKSIMGGLGFPGMG